MGDAESNSHRERSHPHQGEMLAKKINLSPEPLGQFQ